MKTIVDGVLTCLFVGGHALLEGVPGLGKTALIRAGAGADAEVQPHPVHARSDARRRDRHEHHPGKRARPAAVQVHGRADLRADRARRRNQPRHAQDASRRCSKRCRKSRSPPAARSASSKQPFFVMATQNPLEQEGTYPLPEAQLDRFFFKLHRAIQRPRRAEENPRPHDDRLQARHSAGARRRTRSSPTRSWCSASSSPRTCRITPSAARWRRIRRGIFAIPMVNQFLRVGASPRAAQAITLAAKVRALLDGRFHVSFERHQRSRRPRDAASRHPEFRRRSRRDHDGHGA